MLRKFFIATCVVLAIPTAILWFASYWVQARLGLSVTLNPARGGYPEWRRNTALLCATAFAGCLSVELYVPVEAAHEDDGRCQGRGRSYRWREFALLRGGHGTTDPTDARRELFHYDGVELPLWAPLILFTVFPFVAFLRGPLRRHVRRRRGRCVRCGYLLTGLTEPRCPECGTAFDRAGGTGPAPTTSAAQSTTTSHAAHE